MKLISKRIACLLLAVVMAVGLFPASAFAARLKEDVAVAEPRRRTRSLPVWRSARPTLWRPTPPPNWRQRATSPSPAILR